MGATSYAIINVSCFEVITFLGDWREQDTYGFCRLGYGYWELYLRLPWWLRLGWIFAEFSAQSGIEYTLAFSELSSGDSERRLCCSFSSDAG